MKGFKYFILSAAVAYFALPLGAAAPSGYYSPCEGHSGQSLLTALHGVVGPHTTVSYNGLWTLYRTSDTRANGKIWDMYSTAEFTYKSDQCGSYSVVGDCYNREHSFPKSWFSDASPMVSDAFHIYPTYGKVNGQRSNYPYGECEGGTTLPGSGSIRALGRLGRSTFSGYSGTVFEPDDEYKGDFARSYFYMAACYNDRISSWKSDMLNGTSYPAFSPWALNLLLKWHREDPVSDKEIARNDAVYAQQRNRNPFIDHPELVEYIWGDKKDMAWSESGSVEPELIYPVNGSSHNLGTTVTGVARTYELTVKGANLTDDVKLSCNDSHFTATPSTVSRSAANSSAGAPVTVSFTSQTAGDFAADLYVASGSLKSVVHLTAKAINTLPVGPVTAISDDSFLATWSFIGDADANGEYTLDVQQGGVSLDEYPCSVKAADESYVVEGLEPNTTYTYVVKSQHLTSETVSVTTLAPQPSIEFLFDGLLRFSAPVGEPSEAAELIVDAVNIDNEITLTVAAPFQLSVDKAEWGTTLIIDPEQERIYLRMLADKAGSYTSALVARSGDYMTDAVQFEGVAADVLNFCEDFEADASGAGTYNAHQYRGTASLWNCVDAGIWTSDKAHGGRQALRMGKTATSNIEMAEEHLTGMGVVTLWTALFSGDEAATYELQYTVDNGQSWTTVGTATVSSTAYVQQSFVVNQSRPLRLRIEQTAGKRFMIDDIEATAFSGLVPDAVADYHRWDAYCRGGVLVIEADEAVDATVYALDGTVVYSGRVAQGSTTVDVASGLYIVSVDDFARRVLVQ